MAIVPAASYFLSLPKSCAESHYAVQALSSCPKTGYCTAGRKSWCTSVFPIPVDSKANFSLQQGARTRFASTKSSGSFQVRRYLYSLKTECNIILQNLTGSKGALAAATALTASSIAWYTHLYGSIPFIDEVHAGHASDAGLHAVEYPWSHNGLLESFDHARFAYPVVCSVPHF